jgi:hypothetical protein
MLASWTPPLMGINADGLQSARGRAPQSRARSVDGGQSCAASSAQHGNSRDMERKAMKGNRRVFREGRHEQVMTPVRDDSYRATAKLHESMACPDCGAVYHNGRWTWDAAPPDARSHRCPACQHLKDGIPAGYVTMKGAFLDAHRAEVLALVQGCEAREKAEHPMQRIMAVSEAGGGVEVTTTDGHLARGIATALHDAFKGTVDVNFAKEENLVRATWERDD